VATVTVNGDDPTVAVGAFQTVHFTDIATFNPIQTAVLPVVGRDENLVLASTTNTGKTKIAEMVIAECVKNGKPAIYASPLKALTQEKYDLWTSARHPFHTRRISIVTGDYRLTLSRQRELAAAEIILLTSEMLDSRCRNVKSERSEFLMRAGVVVADEFHLLGVAERGDKLEAGLVRFSALNPTARVVALSATLPNVAELAQWVASLNGKPTTFVTSPWRAVPLHTGFRYFQKQRYYADTQKALLHTVFATLDEFPKDDKVLVFVHTKALGRMLLEECEKRSISAQFHCADLELGERLEVESSFRDRANHLRVVIATSTLAWGVNLPARRVIVCGVHRGLEDVNELDILQMVGRAGRMGLDPVGDAYVLLPQPGAEVYQQRIEHPGPIRSNLADPLIAKFHIISEIANGFCTTVPEIRDWYQRTLAFTQRGALTDDDINVLIRELLNDRAITQVAPGKYAATELGMAANYFYLDPSLLRDLTDNWTDTFARLGTIGSEPDDTDVAWALSHTRWAGQLIVSQREADALEGVDAALLGKSYTLSRSQMKAFVCYFHMLRGDRVDILASLHRQLYLDSERLVTALQYLDGRFAHWGQTDWWTNMAIRLRYGVDRTLVPLCRMKGVGRGYATRLYHGGITTPEQFFAHPTKAKALLGEAVWKRIYAANYGSGELVRRNQTDWTSAM
jgi:helicase